MSSINDVFGQNLRKLAQDRGSLADAARALDISKIQFQRMLRGESFPKPAQLKHICDYFGVDARILTEPWPVAQALNLPPDASSLDRIRVAFGMMAGHQDLMPETTTLQDGCYVLWRHSLNDPGHYYKSIVQIRSQNGVRLFKGYLPLRYLREQGELPARGDRQVSLRKIFGVVLSTDEGTSILSINKTPNAIGYHFLWPSRLTLGTSYTGVYFLSTRPSLEFFRLSVAFWERVPDEFAALMAVARQPPRVIPAEAPDQVRRALSMPIDNADRGVATT